MKVTDILTEDDNAGNRQEPTLSVDTIIQAIQNMSPEQLQQLSGPGPELHPDVSVVNSADPLVLRYKSQDYALADDDITWLKFGSNKPASPEMSRFLHKQLRTL